MHDLLADCRRHPRLHHTQERCRDRHGEHPANGKHQHASVVVRQGIVEDGLEEEGLRQPEGRRKHDDRHDGGNAEAVRREERQHAAWVDRRERQLGSIAGVDLGRATGSTATATRREVLGHEGLLSSEWIVRLPHQLRRLPHDVVASQLAVCCTHVARGPHRTARRAARARAAEHAAYVDGAAGRVGPRAAPRTGPDDRGGVGTPAPLGTRRAATDRPALGDRGRGCAPGARIRLPLARPDRPPGRPAGCHRGGRVRGGRGGRESARGGRCLLRAAKRGRPGHAGGHPDPAPSGQNPPVIAPGPAGAGRARRSAGAGPGAGWSGSARERCPAGSCSRPAAGCCSCFARSRP